MKIEKSPSSTCYLCGRTTTDLTDDHIPPKCFAPKNAISDFIVLGACSWCNNKLSNEESKLRDFLSTAGSGWDNKAAEDAFQKARRNFRRNSLGNVLKGNKDFRQIMDNMQKMDLRTKSGIFLGIVDTIKPSDDLEYESVLIKIAKGIHYKFSDQIIPSSYEMRANFIKRNKIVDEICNNFYIFGKCGDFFHYAGGVAHDDPSCGIWLMIFYGKIGALACFVSPEKYQN